MIGGGTPGERLRILVHTSWPDKSAAQCVIKHGQSHSTGSLPRLLLLLPLPAPAALLQLLPRGRQALLAGMRSVWVRD